MTHFPCIALFDNTLIQKPHIFDAYKFKEAVDIVYKSTKPENVEKYSQLRENPQQNDGIRAVVSLLLEWKKQQHDQMLRNQRIERRAKRRKQLEYDKMSSTRYMWFKDGKLNTELADRVIEIKNICNNSLENVPFSYAFAQKILTTYQQRSTSDFQNLLKALSGKYNMYIGYTQSNSSHELVYKSFILDTSKTLAYQHYKSSIPYTYQTQRFTTKILDNYQGQPIFPLFLKNLSWNIISID